MALLVLVIARSTLVTMVSVSVAVLFAADGSGAAAGDVTVAVLVNVSVAELLTVACRLKVAVAPGSRLTVVLMLPLPLAAAQLAPAEGVQVQFTLVSFVGTLSVTVAPVTALKPLLRTTIVYAIGIPATAVEDPSVLVIERSACGVSVSVSVAELLVALGSTAPSGMPTVAVFVRVPVADGLIVAVKLKVIVPPLFRSTLVSMLPVPAVVLQAEPVVAEQVQVALVRIAGSVSTTGTPKTSLKPSL